jgi:hypothetical protein
MLNLSNVISVSELSFFERRYVTIPQKAEESTSDDRSQCFFYMQHNRGRDAATAESIPATVHPTIADPADSQMCGRPPKRGGLDQKDG